MQVLQLIPSILMALLLLGGLILMAVNRQTLGSAATLGLLGCVLLLIGLVFNRLLGFFLPSLVDETELSMSAWVGVWSLVSFILDAAGTGLLIFAVLAKRKASQDAQQQGWGGPQPGWQPGPGGAPQQQGWQQGQGGGPQQQQWPPNYG